MPHPMLSVKGVDRLSIRCRVAGALEYVVDIGRPAAVGELIGVPNGGDGIRAVHILAALGEWFGVSSNIVIELRQIFDDMREMLDGAIEEVVARLGVGESGGTVALARGDGCRTTAIDLLIEEAHPH